ncbi:MAG TPA: hypothetical protein VFF30_10015 [Nitrososphaerales archaeon]|nr:hypothetical protein [Nitrososphaerales archaeon]
MENNGGAATGLVQKKTEPATSTGKDHVEIARVIVSQLQETEGLGGLIDSPRTLLVMRNAIQILSEADENVDIERIFLVIADREYRRGIIGKIEAGTPNYWDESWNAEWRKDADPLYSNSQQRIARRRGLVHFWTKEWDTFPEDYVKSVARSLQALVR